MKNENNKKIMRRNILYIILIIAGFLVPKSVLAHQLSTAYLNVDAKFSHVITGEIRYRLTDIARVISLDSDNNDEVTWREILENSRHIRGWLHDTMSFIAEESSCIANFEGCSGQVKPDTII